MSDAPCPFCRSEQTGQFADSAWRGGPYAWGCCDCGARGPRAATAREARALWNWKATWKVWSSEADDYADLEAARQAAQERDAREADDAYSFSPGWW